MWLSKVAKTNQTPSVVPCDFTIFQASNINPRTLQDGRPPFEHYSVSGVLTWKQITHFRQGYNKYDVVRTDHISPDVSGILFLNV